ncbi:uncharacterized protein [Clytia hemisphaerica]
MARPAHGLENKKVIAALESNIILNIPRSCHILSVRLISLGGESLPLRKDIDIKIGKTPGVEFVISCLTGSENNAKKKKTEEDTREERKIKKGVAYFVVMKQKSIEDEIRRVIAGAGFKSKITYIGPRGENRKATDISLSRLKTTMKDYNNAFGNGLAEEFDQPVCEIVTFRSQYYEDIRGWAQALRTVNVNFVIICGAPSSLEEVLKNRTPTNAACLALESLKTAMNEAKHAVFRGNVYRRVPGAAFAYEKMGPANTYVRSIVVLPDIRDDIYPHSEALIRLLKDTGCNSIRQLAFDADIIELPGEKFFKLSSQCLTKCPYKTSDVGKISPRIFINVPERVNVSGGPFAEAIHNSFPEIKEKMRFIIKFYQCLLAFQLPPKTKKLTLVGHKNSGKTTFVNVVRGLTHPEFIATLSKEKVFGMSMIHDQTQFLFIDEMSPEILTASQAKILLQGGQVTVSRKNQDPEIVENRAGIFITCNNRPKYGDDQKDVEDRMEYMQTKEIPEDERDSFAATWIREHAFECLLWMCNMMRENDEFIDEKELFFVKTVDDYVPVKINVCVPDEELRKLAGIRDKKSTNKTTPPVSNRIDTTAYIDDGQQPGFSKWSDEHNPPQCDSTDSEERTAERLRRLKERRRVRKRHIETTDEDTEEDEEDLLCGVNETMNALLAHLDYAEDGEQVDFVATFLTTSRAHFLRKAEKNDRIFKFTEINTVEYWAEMTRTIVKWFDRGPKRLTFAHYNTFHDNMARHGGVKRRGAKPAIDCWFLVAGLVRDGFDAKSYLAMFPWIENDLRAIRKHLDIKTERKLI